MTNFSGIGSVSRLFTPPGPPRHRIDRASGISVFTTEGRRFVDGSSGPIAVNLGHSHPRVLEAMARQMERATFAYRSHFVSDVVEALAAELCGLLPAGLDRAFLVSGGSEAVEASIKVARQYAVAMGQTARTRIISLSPSYHGATFGSLAVTGHSLRVAPYEAMLAGHPMTKIPAPRPHLEPGMEGGGSELAQALEDEILRLGAETVLAFIFEPIGGAATGANVPPDGYVPAIRKICDDYGVLLIADEVMAGLGRGGHYLACDRWGVVPDVLAVSKGLGAGYVPLGAMVTSERIAGAVNKDGGFIHGHTSSGNPLAAAAGRAVLAELVEAELCAAAEASGARVMAGLRALQERHEFIGHVRGAGLLCGLELVADRASMRPFEGDLAPSTVVAELCYGHGLIVYPGRSGDAFGGPVRDHLIVAPPLNSTEAEVDEVLALLGLALEDFARTL